MWRTLLTAGCAFALAGCATGPLLENPLHLGAPPPLTHGNPVYVPQGPMAYARLFEKVHDVLSDYWEIAYANRYDGRIETHPTIAPGVEQFWKPGSPDPYQRVLAFFQTIRHRAVVQISTADDGGYFVDVKVLQELEDLPNPVRYTAGGATFRLEPTIERQYEVIDTGVFDSNWVPIGRDKYLEQVILDRIAKCDLGAPPNQ
jgi:hypothetical protein